jgi:hypothetical protein
LSPWTPPDPRLRLRLPPNDVTMAGPRRVYFLNTGKLMNWAARDIRVGVA